MHRDHVRLLGFVLLLLPLLVSPPLAEARSGAAPFSENGAGGPLGAIDTYFIPARDGVALALAADEMQRTQGTPHQFADPVPTSITPATHGTWETLPDGARLWRLRIEAPGATDLNLGFGRYRFPPGATLYAIAEDRDYWEGPYTYEDNEEHGQLWLPVTPGDRTIVELHVPRGIEFEPELELVQVGYGFRDWFHSAAPALRQGFCNNDVICPEGDPWRADIKSEGVYQRSGAWTCSGQMVNNTAADFTPYFLTANHCGLNSSNAATMVVYWNFESPSCGDLCCGSLAQNQTGAIFRSSYSTSDFALVELEELPDPAWNVYYAGWDNSGAIPTSAVGIHHPNCDEKAISFDYDPLTITSYLGTSTPGNGSHWRIGVWDDGTTEPGSSGSGLWSPDHHLVGQLHGGYASCTSLTSDWYGRLSVSWGGGGSASTQLKQWLDPLDLGVSTLDGMWTIPPIPTVQILSFTSTDECASGAGGGNGVWEPGELIRIPVELEALHGAFTGVSGTLSTSTPGVTITVGSATWPDIPMGGTAMSNAPFEIRLSPAIACGTVPVLELSVMTAEGGPYLSSFEQVVGQYLIPSGLPVSIPDSNPTGVTSTLTIPTSATLTDVNVRVQITHDYVGDLKIELESPIGTRVTLLDRPGVPAGGRGCQDDDMDVTFDSASSYNLEAHCEGTSPWYVGVAAPVQSLSVLNGQDAAGTWKLIVSDLNLFFTGQLTGWELITTPFTGACEVCNGGTDVPGNLAAAVGFGLAPVRPNPFGSSAELTFALDRAGRTRLEIFDVSGRRVVTILDRELPVGRHSFPWDGRDAAGRTVVAGTYFVRLTSGDRTDLERVVRLR